MLEPLGVQPRSHGPVATFGGRPSWRTASRHRPLPRQHQPDIRQHRAGEAVLGIAGSQIGECRLKLRQQREELCARETGQIAYGNGLHRFLLRLDRDHRGLLTRTDAEDGGLHRLRLQRRERARQRLRPWRRRKA